MLGKNAKTYGSINLLGKYKGTLKKSDFKGDFYAKIFGSDLEHLIDLAHFSHQFSDVSIDNEVWLSIDSDHTSILSNIDIKAMFLGNAKEKIMLGGELSLGMKVSGDELKFTGQEISIQLDNDTIDLSGLYGSLSSKLNQVAFTMPKTELKQLSSFVLNFEPQIPSKKLQNAIKIIRPTGSLSQTFLYLDLEKLGSDYQVVSVLDNVNFGAFFGSPEMRTLS